MICSQHGTLDLEDVSFDGIFILVEVKKVRKHHKNCPYTNSSERSPDTRLPF